MSKKLEFRDVGLYLLKKSEEMYSHAVEQIKNDPAMRERVNVHIPSWLEEARWIQERLRELVRQALD